MCRGIITNQICTRGIRIDGQDIAAGIYEKLRRMPAPRVRMVAVCIGADAASLAFVARKAAVAQSLGIGFERVVFSGNEPQDAVLHAVGALSRDASVGGIILQLPLPKAYHRSAFVRALGLKKDVDNLSGFAAVREPSVRTVQAVLLARKKEFCDYRAVRMVGDGVLVGGPIARFCAASGIPHMVANGKTKDIEQFVRDADLVITGVGKTGIVNPDWLADDAGVIDFGFPPDFNQADLSRNGSRLAFYTSTPQGTGPILIACLFANFYSLNTDLRFKI